MAMARLHKPFQGTPAMLKMAAEVERACTQRTIDWSDPGAPVNADSIPLVLFFEFDEGCNDVAAFDFSSGKEFAGVALDQDIEGSGCWVPCQILGVRKYTYDVVVAGMTQSQRFFRHRVLLPHHKPEEYAESLSKALRARGAAESHARFNLYIKNMPVDGKPVCSQRVGTTVF